MHVASSTLMAIFAFQWSRLAGIMLTIFATGIMIGSFVLGWHYAVDGYAGAMIALASWVVAGVLLRPRNTAATAAAL
jgi:membrane-associated phospholipid phosphatase